MSHKAVNPFHFYRNCTAEALQALAGEVVVPADLDLSRITVEPPRDPSHGDIATNAAMVLSKPAKMKPRDLAEKIAEKLQAADGVTAVEIAGPGFLNLRIADGFWRERVKDILNTGTAYGDSDLGQGSWVNVEYVSANPTGPLHAAHARGAVVGDALAALLEKAGYNVEREYYINDAGAQVDVLARSAFIRYREALGETIDAIPEGLYPGEYLKDVGEALAKRDGDKWLPVEESEWLPEFRAVAVEMMMASIREDLDLLGVKQDLYTSEKSLVESGAVDAVLKTLEDKGLIYVGVLEPPKGKAPDDWEARPQTLFKSSEFGDDVDRALKKSDGSWTYFASDIAYHLEKFQRQRPDGRKIRHLIDVWGADHGGYVKRMSAAVKAITDGEADLDVKLCQIVHLMNDGKQVRMSKRAGTFVTLRDVLEQVDEVAGPGKGKDVVRFIMLTRRNDQTMEFDFAKVTEAAKENPVFYVQYAHARHNSSMRNARETFPDLDLSEASLVQARLDLLEDEGELALMRQLAQWPRMVEGAAEAHEPHRIAQYLHELASAFHAQWNKGRDNPQLRFIREDDRDLTLARQALVRSVGLVIASGLAIFAVEPVEEMR